MNNDRLSMSTSLRARRMLAVFILIVYLSACLAALGHQLLQHAEDQCIQRLKETASEYSSTYYAHAMSDREQLRVVADMIAVLMEEGVHDLHVHLASFEQRGMLDWLQVLLPDGTLLTGTGTYDMTGRVDYQAEAASLPYLTNVSPGFVDPSKRVIRSAVPILENGQTIAILYGVYDLTAGHKLEGVTSYAGQAYTFVFESDTGNYILDGLRGHETTGSTGSTYQPKPGYDLSRMQQDLTACREGYSAFASLSINEYMYIYYMPIGINNWMVMVSVPESAAMSFAFDSRTLLHTALLYVALGVLCYFAFINHLDNKLNEKHQFISTIQSRLMEVSHNPEQFTSALNTVAERTQGNALFLVDETLPHSFRILGRSSSLCEAYDQSSAEVNAELLTLCRQQKRSLYLHPRSKLLRECPRLAQLMLQHRQTDLALVPIVSQDGNIHQIMGVFDPANRNALLLLDVLAPDFFIAANNIDFITRLNIASTVDNLTGTLNRTSYHLKLERLCSAVPQGFACAYIDVNDLHAINNRFGHEKGDDMLRTIAGALMDACGKENVYRYGGDEFIILVENVTEQWIQEALNQADATISDAGYAVSVGYEWNAQADDIDGMIRNAESRMYDAKYLYYQQKESSHAKRQVKEQSLQRLLTGNPDIDAFLHVAGNHYRGVYIVNLLTNEVREIIAHTYFHIFLQENNQKFSNAFQHYIAESVDKQSRRSVQNFFNYRQISAQIAANLSPVVEYTKIDGERVRLTVHRLASYTPESPETLWVIEVI